jgi:hypothetical protein
MKVTELSGRWRGCHPHWRQLTLETGRLRYHTHVQEVCGFSTPEMVECGKRERERERESEVCPLLDVASGLILRVGGIG